MTLRIQGLALLLACAANVQAEDAVLELPDSIRAPAAISPDGTQVAYVARIKHAGDFRYAYRVATLGQPRLEVRDVLVCDPAADDEVFATSLQPGCWSPDSRRLGIVRRHTRGQLLQTADSEPHSMWSEVSWIDLASGARTVLAAAEGTAMTGLRFHPTQNLVAWAEIDVSQLPEFSGRVRVANLDEGSVTTLALPAGFVPWEVAYLADGRAVIPCASKPSLFTRVPSRLWVAPADGSRGQLVGPELALDEFFWRGLLAASVDSDGRVVAEVRAGPRKRPSLISVLRLGDETARPLTAPGEWSLVAWVADDRASVWSPELKQAGELNLSSGEVTPLGHSRVVVHARSGRTVTCDMSSKTLFVR